MGNCNHSWTYLSTFQNWQTHLIWVWIISIKKVSSIWFSPTWQQILITQRIAIKPQQHFRKFILLLQRQWNPFKVINRKRQFFRPWLKVAIPPFKLNAKQKVIIVLISFNRINGRTFLFSHENHRFIRLSQRILIQLRTKNHLGPQSISQFQNRIKISQSTQQILLPKWNQTH